MCITTYITKAPPMIAKTGWVMKYVMGYRPRLRAHLRTLYDATNNPNEPANNTAATMNTATYVPTNTCAA